MKQLVFPFFFCLVLAFSCQKSRQHTSVSTEPKSPVLIQLDEKIKSLAKEKKWDSIIVLSKEMAIEAKKMNDSLALAKAHFRLGYYNIQIFSQLDAFENYDKALELYKKLGEIRLAGSMLKSMANIQKSVGDFNGAYISATDALALIEDFNLKEKYGAYHAIAISLKEDGKLQQSFEWSNKLKELFENNDSLDLRKEIRGYKNTRANILADLNRYDEAIELLQELIVDEEIIKNKGRYARVLTNFAHVKWLKEASNSESETMLLEGLEIRKEINDISGLISSNVNLVHYYSKSWPKKALAYANDALKYSTALNNPAAKLETLDLLIPIKTELGESVAEEAKLYSKTSNELRALQKEIRDIYALTKFNNDQLERENLILQTATAKKDRQRTWFLAAFIIAVIGIAFVLIYKNIQRKQELLRASLQTEAKISKKVHDELANDISGIMNYVDLSYGEKGESKENVIKYLSSVYQRARNIAMIHASIDVEDYEKALKNLIAQHHPKDVQVIMSPVTSIDWNTLSEIKKITLYKGLQELLINTKKHSQATSISIVFKNDGKKVVTIYSDNGVGFIANEKSLSGLYNVETRMKESGGNFSFETSEGNGFRARLVI